MAGQDRVTLLRDEHRAIVRRVAAVGRQVGASPPAPPGDLRESISGLGLLLKTHFAHEEAAVFRPLDARLRGRSPIGELVDDHRSIREALDRLAGVCLAAGVTPAEKRDRFSSFRSLLDQHLEKEEKVVFWLAEIRL